MEFILFVFDRIANAPSITAAIANMVIAMANVDPGTPVAASAIAVGIANATARNVVIFRLYIAALIITALILAYLTWLVWDAGNKVQDAVQADADARIIEAQNAAKKIGIELAKQQEKAAIAERALLDLQQALADRTLTKEQQQDIGGKLARFSGQRYAVVAYWDSKESLGFANCIHGALQFAHWTYLPPPSTGIALFGGIVGVKVFRHPEADEGTRKAADLLVNELSSRGFQAVLEIEGVTNNPKNNDISLSVGSKR